MHIIKLNPTGNGVYLSEHRDVAAPFDGYAMIPDDFELPASFPHLSELEAEEKTNTYDMEVEKEVVKTREVVNENGETITEEYTEMEMVTEQRERTILIVTKMTEGTVPEPVEPEPTAQEDTDAMLIDHEYRLTMLELGLTEEV